MRATFFMDFWTHPGIRIEIHAYGELGYSHREPLRAGVAAPHPYFQKGIRESAKSKRRESVRAAPKRLRQQVATERSDSDELRRRETPASALSAVFLMCQEPGIHIINQFTSKAYPETNRKHPHSQPRTPRVLQNLHFC